MSSNAFPRSRSRVRHHRVPRTLSCDHPRFLQLVNELARINRNHHNLNTNNNNNSNNNNNNNQSQNEAQQSEIQQPQQQQQQQQQLHSTHHTNLTSNNLHHSQQPQPQHHHHHHHQDDCCINKQQDQTQANFGYSKQSLVEQQNSSDFSSDNPDLRTSQDENRSKRKRPSNDSMAANNTRKSSSSSCGGSNSGTTSKRHKSSPDNVRPLSPSFTKCPICLLDCMDRDPSFTNTCFHLFCYVCIDNWTKSKATCPLCRTKFTKILHNIKSATNYQEQIASPIRRDDDDGYIADRLMLEHLSTLNPNSAASSRNNNADEVQFLFENLRGSEVLMPQYFVNQIDPRQGESSVHSFNTVTTSTNFNSNVPHLPFNATNYPMTSNYIALFPNRIGPPQNTPMTGAYTSNTSLTNLNNDPNARHISRSGRLFFSRNYEPPMVSDSSTRTPRASATSANQPSVNLDRNHHHHHHHQQQPQHPHSHQPQHPGHHQHQHQHHQHNHQRSTIDMNSRQTTRLEQLNAHIQPAYYLHPRHHNPIQSAYTRRFNPQVENHILDLYRHMPDSM